MIEKHAFGEFVPPGEKYLILGTFTGRVDGSDPGYDWFYCTKRNQFWPIIEQVYDRDLGSTKAKIDLFSALGIALADTIASCERIRASNLDASLRMLSAALASAGAPGVQRAPARYRRLSPERAFSPRSTLPQMVVALPDATTALQQITGWFEDYNTSHPHSGLRMRSPREFIAAQSQ